MSRGITAEQLPEALRNDDQVRFVIIDVDGQLRGQTVSKESFIEDAADGIGMATIVFAFDVQDGIYETPMNRKWVANGFSNIMAVPDLSTFRRIPWEDNMPFVICDLVDGPDSKRIPMSPRDVLKIVVDKVRQRKIRALAGGGFLFLIPLH